MFENALLIVAAIGLTALAAFFVMVVALSLRTLPRPLLLTQTVVCGLMAAALVHLSPS